MLDLTRIYYFVFGVLTIAGGLVGFLKANSTPSLIAGGISGLLVIVAGVLLRNNVMAGLILGGVVSLALAGRFLPAFLSTHKWMPAGMMAILSVIAIVLTVVAFAKK
jgi:uncharacterized membrane protein (UPF0136 family)